MFLKCIFKLPVTFFIAYSFINSFSETNGYPTVNFCAEVFAIHCVLACIAASASALHTSAMADTKPGWCALLFANHSGRNHWLLRGWHGPLWSCHIQRLRRGQAKAYCGDCRRQGGFACAEDYWLIKRTILWSFWSALNYHFITHVFLPLLVDFLVSLL